MLFANVVLLVVVAAAAAAAGQTSNKLKINLIRNFHCKFAANEREKGKNDCKRPKVMGAGK